MEALKGDNEQLENEGYEILVIGDFNLHIEEVKRNVIEREGIKARTQH